MALVLAVATLGDGGMSPYGQLAQHLLLAVAVVVRLLRGPGGSAPDAPPARAWLLFAGLVAVGALAAPYAYAAWLVLVELIACGALAWLAASEPAATRTALRGVIGVTAFAHGLTAVVEKLGGASRPASTFLNPNHLAAWLGAAAVFLAAVLADRGASRAVRWGCGASIGAAVAGIFVTGSRGALLGMAVGGAVLIAASRHELSARGRRAMTAAIVGVVVVAAVGVTVRFEAGSDPYSFHRTRIWGASVAAFAQSPWLGTGPGQFAAAAPNMNFPLEEAPLRFERGFRSPHSDLLRVFCEFGVLAGIAALCCAGFFVVSAWRRAAASPGAERGALAAIAALAAQGLVDDLSSRPGITLTAAALAGLLVARPRTGLPEKRPAVAASAALLVALALGAGEVAGFLGWHHLPSEPRRAISWNPLHPDLWRRVAEQELGDGRSLTIEAYAAAREASERARRLQPADAFYARAAARIEAAACRTLFPFTATRARVVALYDDAAALARTDATIPLESAAFQLQTGDPAGARRAVERALRIEPGSAVPRIWLARALLQEDGAKAITRARSLVEEAVALALPAGTVPSSPYEAALRAVDPAMLAETRAEIDAAASR